MYRKNDVDGHRNQGQGSDRWHKRCYRVKGDGTDSTGEANGMVETVFTWMDPRGLSSGTWTVSITASGGWTRVRKSRTTAIQREDRCP